jgi:hypothetical protein
MYIDWKGRGQPRKFCYECKYLVDEYSGGLDDACELRLTYGLRE